MHARHRPGVAVRRQGPVGPSAGRLLGPVREVNRSEHTAFASLEGGTTDIGFAMPADRLSTMVDRLARPGSRSADVSPGDDRKSAAWRLTDGGGGSSDDQTGSDDKCLELDGIIACGEQLADC